MTLNKNILFATVTFLTGILVVIVPLYIPDGLMNSVRTGKSIFFVLAMLFIVPIAILPYLHGRFSKQSSITRLDILVAVWFVYILVKSIVAKTPFSLFFAEFIGISALYAVLRSINSRHIKWLFFALIVAGAIQAVYGNLQLWGYYQSHHHLFKLTGSFFNPGPYAGYIAVILPVALGFWLFGIKLIAAGEKGDTKVLLQLDNIVQKVFKATLYRFTKNNNKVKESSSFIVTGFNTIVQYLSGAAIIAIGVVLPASQSRAAWLAVLVSSGYLFAVKYNVLHKFTEFKLAVWKKTTLVAITVAIVLSGLVAMYYLKKDSADGRKLIWKVTLNMIADNPVTGNGIDGFNANYMDNQAGYFKSNPDSDEAMLAGDTNYAFNELLQQTAEHGLTGSILLLLIFISAFSTPVYGKQKPNGLQGNWQFAVMSKALLLSFVVFAMFSYPVQILPIKISMVIALAQLAGCGQNVFTGKAVFNKRIYALFVARGFILCGIAVFVYYGSRFLKAETGALKDWKYAFTLYGMGDYSASVAAYKNAESVLQNNGDFLTNYGKALTMANQHNRAIVVLQKATKVCPNTVVYTALGDSYKATNQNSAAENAYLHAWYMNPSRFYPMYLLAKLYDETGQQKKAVAIARKIVDKKVKVQSTAIKEIKKEVTDIINKNSSLIIKKEGNNNHKSQYLFQLQFW